MELLALLFLAGVVFVVVGAIEGMVARRQNVELRRRVERLERDLRRLLADRAVDEHARSPSAEVDAEVEPADRPVPERDVGPPAPVERRAPPRRPDAVVDAPRTPAPPPAAAPIPALAPRPDAPPIEAGSAMPAPVVGARLEAVEKALGTRWLTWVGVGLLFLGVAFFLDYAHDRDWFGRYFGPRLRIATATLAALVLAFVGWRSLRNGLVSLGQGLLGGSQALLYLTVFAAFQPVAMVVDEPLIDATTAFAAMAAVTALGLAAAVRLDAIAMAFLAVLGGMATPVVISTGQDARDALFGYLLLLDLGVLGVASYRQWRALDLLAFAGTALLFGGWWSRWHAAHPQPDATLVWLVVFHLVFLVLPFAQHWRRRTPVTIERFGLALGNVAITLGFAATMLREPAPRLLASGCLAAATLYAALGVFSGRRVGGDVRTRDGFLALGVLLVTVGLFFMLPGNAITTAWFGEATALLWLGYRFAHERARLVALAVLLVAVARTVAVHLPAAPREAGLLWNDWYGALVVAAVGTGLFARLHARRAADDAERRLGNVAGVAAGLWLCAVTAAELDRHARHAPLAWQSLSPSLAIAWLWLAGSLAFVLYALRRPSRVTLTGGLLPLLGAVVAVGAAYDGYATDALPVWNGPCLAGLAAVALALFTATRAARAGDAGLRAPLTGAAQLGLTLLATVETAAYVQRGDTPPPATIAQSLTWVWLACAIPGLAIGAALASRRVLLLAALPLGAALFGAFVTYGLEPGTPRLVANQRFVAALLACAVVAALRGPLRRTGMPQPADAVAAAALVLALGFGAAESITWTRVTSGDATFTGTLLLLLGTTAVLGTAGACWRAHATGNRTLGAAGRLALAPALVLPLADYFAELDTGWMFVNLRAALTAAAGLTALAWSRTEPRLAGLRHAALAVALIGATLEPPVWLLDHVEDPSEATRLARFSVTVTWLVSATALLVAGFRRDRRAWRLTALGLFAATAAKALLVDMSGAQQIYRILAFLLVGVVFVGASWLYHRAERRLRATRPGGDETA